MAAVTSVQEFREKIQQHDLAIFLFFDKERTAKSQEYPVEKALLNIHTPKSLGLFDVNLKRYPEVSQAANVDAPMLVVFKDGEEVTRYLGGDTEQIEYVVSRVLSGLMGPNGELSAET